MALILEFLTYFGVGFVGGLVYHVGVKRRPWVEALHLAAIFGMAVMLLLFAVLLAADIVSR